MLAVVIGRNGGEADPGRWGWYVWEDGDYQLIDRGEREQRICMGGDQEIAVWRADATGVFEA